MESPSADRKKTLFLLTMAGAVSAIISVALILRTGKADLINGVIFGLSFVLPWPSFIRASDRLSNFCCLPPHAAADRLSGLVGLWAYLALPRPHANSSNAVDEMLLLAVFAAGCLV